MINSKNTPGKPVAEFSDFSKIDLRVGRITKVENISGSDKLLKMHVELGQELGNRQILAGIARWYKDAQLIGKKFVFITNLAPRKMMGEESQGMMLGADVEGECKLIPVDKSIPVGTIVR